LQLFIKSVTDRERSADLGRHLQYQAGALGLVATKIDQMNSVAAVPVHTKRLRPSATQRLISLQKSPVERYLRVAHQYRDLLSSREVTHLIQSNRAQRSRRNFRRRSKLRVRHEDIIDADRHRKCHFAQETAAHVQCKLCRWI